jgi:mycoredoxin
MDSPVTPPDHGEIVVYWRPGCLFCRMLRRKLERRGIAHRTVNIWDDPTAAAFVRSVAAGNETVPTVTVAGAALVNPSVDDILDAAGRHGARSSAAGTRSPGRLGRVLARLGRRPSPTPGTPRV